MNRLIRAEIRKLLTTSWFKVTLAVAAILGPVSAVAIALTWKGDVPLGSSDGIHRVLGSAALTSMVMLGVGIAAMAGEYRHNTSIPTFLITPRRRDVIVAKLITITGVGAIVGGLIVGASEKLAEVYVGPHVGGGIEGWFPYVLALLFLLVRPEGLFGEKIIRRI